MGFLLLVQLEIQTAHHKHKMASINPWILIFNVHPPYYPHHHHQHIPPYQRRQNSLSLSKLTIYTNQNMSSLVTCPSTNPCAGSLATHPQPTHTNIHFPSFHRNHGRCCAHTNFTKTHLASAWDDGTITTSPGWRFIHGCTWQNPVDTLMLLSILVGSAFGKMNLPNDEMTCHFPKHTGGTLRDSFMRTFLPHSSEHMLPHPPQADLAIVSVFQSHDGKFMQCLEAMKNC